MANQTLSTPAWKAIGSLESKMAHSSEIAKTTRVPWLTGVLLLVGFGVIYWAEDQLVDIQQITASLFLFPIGRMLS